MPQQSKHWGTYIEPATSTLKYMHLEQWRSQPNNLVMLYKYFRVYDFENISFEKK